MFFRVQRELFVFQLQFIPHKAHFQFFLLPIQFFRVLKMSFVVEFFLRVCSNFQCFISVFGSEFGFLVQFGLFSASNPGFRLQIHFQLIFTVIFALIAPFHVLFANYSPVCPFQLRFHLLLRLFRAKCPLISHFCSI